MEKKRIIHVLDYGAGNVRSLKNAIRAVGFEPVDIKSPDELKNINSLIFPGVGAFGSAMEYLQENGKTNNNNKCSDSHDSFKAQQVTSNPCERI